MFITYKFVFKLGIRYEITTYIIHKYSIGGSITHIPRDYAPEVCTNEKENEKLVDEQ